jgi:hypothetical protein
VAIDALLRAYRATGADLPFGDPRRAHHGVAMEGYFWRFTDPAGGRVVVALCGVNRAPDGRRWATVALAGHPGGFLRQAAVSPAGADGSRLGAWAGAGAFDGAADHVRVHLGDDARLDVELRGVRDWPRRLFGGVGPAHAVPGLSQYWHPHVLGGVGHGHAVLGDEVVRLDGYRVYAEKNWGRSGFPERWWWGQALGFDDPEVCVAFAGGEVRAGPARLEASAIAVRLGDRLVRVGQPLLSPVRADVRDGHWHLRSRGAGWTVEVEASAVPGAAHVLPVPMPAERRNVPGAHQHLAGRLRIAIRRRGRLVYAGESALAGLERGDLAAAESAVRSAARAPHRAVAEAGAPPGG